jgi:hypothetical protein
MAHTGSKQEGEHLQNNNRAKPEQLKLSKTYNIEQLKLSKSLIHQHCYNSRLLVCKAYRVSSTLCANPPVLDNLSRSPYKVKTAPYMQKKYLYPEITRPGHRLGPPHSSSLAPVLGYGREGSAK